jgi:hypothetical protein
MSQDRIELTEPHAFHLRRLDLILAELARPTLDVGGIELSTRKRLTGLGIDMAEESNRGELIRRVWDRKRELTRCAAAAHDLSPWPPSA